MIFDEAVRPLSWPSRSAAGEDADVAQRFLAGDRQAIRTVDSWILRAAWPFERRLRHRWDDVLQDVRLEITRLLAQGRFHGDSSLKTYLFRVVSHTCVDQVRALTRRPTENLDDLAGIDQPLAPGPSPADREADRDLLLRVLDRVPGECRSMWKMLASGISYQEMSDRMAVAPGTLRVRVLRCREKATRARSELLAGSRGNGSSRIAPIKSGGNANDLR